MEEEQNESKNIEILHYVYETPIENQKMDETEDSQSCESPHQEVIFAEVQFSGDENESESIKCEEVDRFTPEEEYMIENKNLEQEGLVESEESNIVEIEDLNQEELVENAGAEDSTPSIFPYTPDRKTVKIDRISDIKVEDGYILQEITKYECKTCGDAFLYPSGIMNHMNKKHNQQDIDCEEYSVKGFRKIKKITPKPDPLLYLPEIPAVPTHKCLICKKLFDDGAALKEHQTIHKVYVCEVCGRGFLKKSYLQDHREAHGTEKAYKCKFCDKSFKRRTVLVKHKRIHTHPRQCICEYCGKRFNDNGTLKTHKLLLHTKERNFKCMICGQTFPLKPTLDKHIRRHVKRERGVKDFPCDKCDMKYRDKSSLNRHQLAKHSGIDFKVKCQDCGKQYTTSTNLFKHRRLHHKDKEVISLEVEWTKDKQ